MEKSPWKVIVGKLVMKSSHLMKPERLMMALEEHACGPHSAPAKSIPYRQAVFLKDLLQYEHGLPI
jgi:hypothetical protein